MPGIFVALAGTGGVEPGSTKLWGYMMTTGLSTMRLESTARPIGHISLQVKLAGKRSAGNLHAAFDVAGTGNVALSQRASSRPYLRGPGGAIPPGYSPVEISIRRVRTTKLEDQLFWMQKQG